MSFNPNLPAQNSLISSAELRSQFNGLKELIDAVLASAVIDEVVTLPADAQATVSVSLVDGVLHLSFGIPAGAQGEPGEPGPAGNDGGPGPQGNDGNPGEVTTAALNDAIAGTAHNPLGLATLDTPFADPDAESLRQAYNALLTVLLRSPA